MTDNNNDDLLIDDFLDDDEPSKTADAESNATAQEKPSNAKKEKTKNKKAEKPPKTKNGISRLWSIPLLSTWIILAALFAAVKYGIAIQLGDQIVHAEIEKKGLSALERVEYVLLENNNIAYSIADRPQVIEEISRLQQELIATNKAKDEEARQEKLRQNSLNQYQESDEDHDENGEEIVDADKTTDSTAEKPSKEDTAPSIENLQSTPIETLLLSSFPEAESLRLIPWTIAGTAALKKAGIPFKNTIELAMLARIDKHGETAPEIYQYNKVWLINFAAPVKHEDKLIGFVLLTLKASALEKVLDTPYFTSGSNIALKKSGTVFSRGNVSNGMSKEFETSIKHAKLYIESDKSNLTIIENNLNIIYICLGIAALLISITCIIGMMLSRRVLRQDCEAIQRYLGSLSGIHKTQKPKLSIGLLDPIVEDVTNISKKVQRTAVNPENTSRRRPDAGTSATDVAPTVKLPTVDELPAVEESPAATNTGFEFPHIFRDYDIRGIAETELNDANVDLIGRAIGTEAAKRGSKNIAIARDGRLSSDRIFNSLSTAICSTGCSVIDVGVVPTPALYFATYSMNTNAGVMITASHNGAEYNGFKIVLGGKTLQGEDIQSLLKCINSNSFEEGNGQKGTMNIAQDYISEISSDIIIARPLKVVVDAGNGVGGQIAVELLSQLDCEVVPLNCDINGNFPNHDPDPSAAANLSQLVSSVRSESADIGIAYDGDADRMVAVTAEGKIVPGDQMLMIFANDVVSRNPAADVIYDVKCSRNISQMISQYGGRPVMWKTGHSNIKAKMEETGALLGGEYTGHFFFKERWYGFDDGIYASLRLLELLTTDDATLDERISELPQSFSTEEISIPVANSTEKQSIVEAVKKSLADQGGDVNTLDGIRIDYPTGWGLVRASNTSDSISTRFEANSEAELAQIQNVFKEALMQANPSLHIPF